ncbi:MAG TPA: polysaccharide deacetylase family protein [Solirubrobacterales bacterium]|nr:polysaccharide deacetylase family protein [Solirubrobacterales bacterium]
MSEGWCSAPWRTRMLRRLRLPAAAVTPLARRSPRWKELRNDLAHWARVRQEASDEQWRRLTSSYSVLVYHRFAGEMKPGQERIDIAPRRYYRQLRLLRLLGFRPLPLTHLLAFHRGERNHLPRRRFVVTVDDAIADAVEPLRRTAHLSPQLFVPSAEVAGAAHWVDGEPVAGWDEIRSLAAAGVAIGSHTRHHRRLSQLGAAEREVELVGSLAELREQVSGAVAVLAYPNGDHDDAVCAATEEAGYELAYTTEKGRNDASTDEYRLRRVSVHGADGALAVLWKVLTGEALPSWWLRLRR